ncbi:G2/M phase-specific E3 ubiquitin-protein ligase [Oryzias melastigma]|uniref:G2/M phase-specific E3 ubiquitin-protein ligase n=1 Tax=Oryzias melastigma TaxID=30732 RepID=A0A834F7S6_ORYME|nr:G2/M phase-specific E3 ubiquitin-protein ligase [Oryzias melastigma]
MRLGERKAVLLAISEQIEMELFSSEECCVVKKQEKKEENNFEQRCRYLEHPLEPDCEEREEADFQVQPRQQTHFKAKLSVQEEPQFYPHILELTDEMEMESFPSIRISDIELVEIHSGDSSVVTPQSLRKTTSIKWKSLTPQKTGLEVKDVICLTRRHYMTQLERQNSPENRVRAASGLTARITIDHSWSAGQVEGRLTLLFWDWFVKKVGQRFSFTYLQCVQGSKALFVPDTPAEGWTGEQVLRISGRGALYILSHQDYPQAECKSETSLPNGKENDKRLVKRIHHRICKTPERLTLNLDTILKLYRQSMDRDVETPVQVRSGFALQSALKAVRRPGFSCRWTPVISFSEEWTDGLVDPIWEFFRLSLLELQQSQVFEGSPGRLFFTYDLTALEDGKYYEAGVLIGWSLAQGGPGPHCLHPELYKLLCGHNPSLENFNWRDIADPVVQARLQELHGCRDVKLLSPSLCEWVSHCGIPGIYSAYSTEMPTIYACLVKHYIYHRVASMISQFTQGLNSCGGLWDLVKAHWEMFLPVMTSTRRQQPLTLEEFMKLFNVSFSHSDSELRAAEEATFSHWQTVLNLVRDGLTDFSFEDLLIFITGTDHLPSLGFPELISLRFYSLDPADIRLPHSSSDSLELFLPRGVAGTVDLLVLLSRALRRSLGFTDLNAEEDQEENFPELLSS